MEPLGISDAEFEREVLYTDGLVLVYFWAPWSRTCQGLLSVIKSIADRHDGEAKIVTLNVDKNAKIPQEYGVEVTPAIFFFAGGRVVDRLNGITSEHHLDARIQRLLPVPV